MTEDNELDIVEMEDDEGGKFQLRVARYFYYNGEEYVVLTDDVDNPQDDLSKVELAIMRVVEDEEEDMETFEPIENSLAEALEPIVRANFAEE